MRRRPQRIACLLIAALLALPAAAWGQSAGDEQYEDPFAPGSGQSDDGGGDSGGDSGGGSTGTTGGGSSGSSGGSTGGGSAGTPGGSTDASGEAPAAQPAAQTESAPAAQLPRTGADSGVMALAGALLLVGGVALRVRLSEPAPRRR
jgi:LPXTG-motif cell wall-anchored protein